MTAGLSSPEPEDGGAVALNGPIPDSASAAGATNTANPDRSATEGAEGLRNDLGADPIRRLARVLDPVAYDPRAIPENVGQGWDRKRRQMVAEVHATAALADGYRRVVEDDDTTERLAAILAKADGWFPWVQPPDVEQEVAVVDDIKDGFRSMARAAVRALREETRDVELCQACGNPASEGQHGMSEFGGCV